MLRRVITAKEGEKLFSLEYSPISKNWHVSSKRGKILCVVPSDRCFIRTERYKKHERKSTVQTLKAYAREKFPESRYDVGYVDDRLYLALYRNFNRCEFVELEPFALARLFSLYSNNGFAIDWGRRKTVFVEVEGGLLKSFRVVLRGGDYITQRVCEAKSLSLEEAEKLKKSEGLSLAEVKASVEEILELSGYSFEERKVLLTGGGSRLKGLEGLFPQVIPLTYCEPEYAVCLGACLREVLKNPYPDFTRRELSQEDLRKIAFSGVGIAVAFFVSLLAMQRLYSTQELRELQRTEFKKLFPREPIVSLHQQVRAKVSTGEEYRLTKLFVKAQESLKPGMKLYRFEYADGRLSVKGEADRKTLEGLKLQSTKETPAGSVEFEIRLP
ncbi:MAG: cell division FtsA domain-containing protein [Aquificaceae bacterium]|nr:hypothetical protein [Aquificaceae bacterium]MDW8423689.1 cell division FtsA domain-containing protein [Aquificaceae bacterium]